MVELDLKPYAATISTTMHSGRGIVDDLTVFFFQRDSCRSDIIDIKDEDGGDANDGGCSVTGGGFHNFLEVGGGDSQWSSNLLLSISVLHQHTHKVCVCVFCVSLLR